MKRFLKYSAIFFLLLCVFLPGRFVGAQASSFTPAQQTQYNGLNTQQKQFYQMGMSEGMGFDKSMTLAGYSYPQRVVDEINSVRQNNNANSPTLSLDQVNAKVNADTTAAAAAANPSDPTLAAAAAAATASNVQLNAGAPTDQSALNSAVVGTPCTTSSGHAGTVTKYANSEAAPFCQDNSQPQPSSDGTCGLSNISACFMSLLAKVSQFIFGAMALLLWLAGSMLDWVLNYTIIQMSQNIGAMTGINIVWKVIRDLANIAFIFILLYEAILLIISKSSTEKIKGIIAGIVITALLINFSLFFTKVIIDASNVVTVGFYQSIVGASPPVTPASTASNTFVIPPGISGAFINNLHVVNFVGSQDVSKLNSSETNGDYKGITMIALGGSVLFLILSFVFFAISIMYLMRYIVLVVLLMSAPLGYLGFGLPPLKSTQSSWWSTLIGQCIFAPLWMFCCWAILTLVGAGGFLTLSGGASLDSLSAKGAMSDIVSGVGGVAAPSGIPLIVNFALIIGLVIGSLSLAKRYAGQGSNMIGSWTGKATAFAGGAIMGGAAWGGRKAIGQPANWISNNASLQEAANKKRGLLGGLTVGAGARLALYASKKARSGSFDVRSATIPTNVIGDAIGGTVGRTRIGKALGLNDVNIPGIGIGAMAAGMAGAGKGGEKGYKETREESQKRVRDREAAATTELKLAQNKKAVVVGSKTTATALEITAMEDALSKLSVKETETLVASNRELLSSLNFANRISVQQLDALNKSDQFSETEKNNLKNARFSTINTAMSAGTLAAVGAVRNNIRDLSDSELEMIDPAYLGNQHFVSHLKSGQMETINKSNKFTTSQKGSLRTTRRAPLMAAIAVGNVAGTQTILRGLGHKEVASLDMVTLLDPTMLQAYIPNMLQRMSPEMNPADIPILRAAIIATVPSAPAAAWLITPAGVAAFS